MSDTEEDTFYECLTPHETPPTTKKFFLPLSTISIYCRQNGSAKSSNKPSHLLQNGNSSLQSDSATIGSLPPRKSASPQSSVVEDSYAGHMASTDATLPPTTPPSTPPSSCVRLQSAHRNSGVIGCLDLSPPSSAPPLSPSSSVSTSSQSLSEPPTPTRNGSIDPSRFSTSPPSPPSSKTSNSTRIDDLTFSGSNLYHSDATRPQTPAIPTQKPVRKNHNFQSLASKKTTASRTLVRKRKASKFIPETGPFVPEGFNFVNWPEAHSVIATETFEAGHVIGYGTYPVQPTARELARQKRQIMRNKLRYYGLDDEVKNVRSSGSVTGESETLSEGEQNSEKECGFGGVWKKEDTDADTLIEVKSVGLGISSADDDPCA